MARAGGEGISGGGGGCGADSAAVPRGRAAPVTWRPVLRAAEEAAAHALLLCFTALLALKLDGLFTRSWWLLFIPLWLFHAVIARYRFSLPGLSSSQCCQRISCHSIVAIPLLVAFELLLCVYLEVIDDQGESFIDLKLVFLPLLALEIITLIDNFRMCGALMPGYGETMTDEAIWERLPGTPSNARFIPIRAIFLPILLLQVAAVCFSVWRFFERLVVKLQDGMISERYISISSKIDDLFMMIQCGSRLVTWWSIDEDSKEEQAHLCYTNNIGYSTFCSYPPEMIKEMPKKVLVKEVQRLQLALGEQTKMAKLSQQQCDRLKNERILCRICFERDICIVLLPCRHHVLCETCSNKCQSCPICRVTIESKLSVYDGMSTADLLSDTV